MTTQVPALVAPTVLAVVTTALVAYEALRFSDVRERARHGGEVAVSERRAPQAP